MRRIMMNWKETRDAVTVMMPTSMEKEKTKRKTTMMTKISTTEIIMMDAMTTTVEEIAIYFTETEVEK